MSRHSIKVGSILVWAVIAVGAAIAAWSLPIDDFWLSIASGRELRAGAPLNDPLPFSWTLARTDAINPQWGAQLLLGGTGSLGVALAMNAALIAGGLLITGWRARIRASLIPAGLAMLISLLALAPHLLARAQSFSIALFPLSLLVLERFASRWWLPAAYGALMVVWANLHGAFVIGQVAAAAWLVLALRDGRNRRIAGLTVGVAMVAPIINPAGAALLRYAYAQPATDVVRAISVEWQPAWPWIAVATPFWIVLLLVVGGRLVRRQGASLAELAFLVALALLAMSGIRHIPWFVIAAVPVLADDFSPLLTKAPRFAKALGSPSASAMRVLPIAAVFMAASVAFQFARPHLPRTIARLTPDAPVTLSDALEAELKGGDRILNEQVWGGYLAYRFGPPLQTAMDGRLEIRTREVWQGYFDLMHGDGDPGAALARSRVGWAILMRDRDELIASLEASGWSTVEATDEGVLMRAPGP